jgi:hypothetical protein
MKTWTNSSHAKLPPTGPWAQEPDKAQWVDGPTGLDCLVVRSAMGGLCGYVGVPQGHEWHGGDYDLPPVDVHGGLTFAGGCQEDASEDSGICHAGGAHQGVWWLGFDCMHAFDLIPNMSPHYPPLSREEVYRDFSYVRNQCAKLAQQVADAAA